MHMDKVELVCNMYTPLDIYDNDAYIGKYLAQKKPTDVGLPVPCAS
jgi:hypothetical protein